jgi:hypothetical protein
LLAAEAREALARGDVAAARTNLDALRRRRGGLKIEIAARAFRLAPQTALWAYRAYRENLAT